MSVVKTRDLAEEEMRRRMPMQPKDLLPACKPVFQELVERFGNGGASLGVLKDGRADYLGLGMMTPPSEDTVYLISSMTKPILAVAVGILVATGKIELETLVRDIIPLNAVCNHRDGTPLRVADLLDHRSELFRCDRLWEGYDGRINIQEKDEILELYKHLPPNWNFNSESTFHHTRNYSNLGYALLAIIIEEITGAGPSLFMERSLTLWG